MFVLMCLDGAQGRKIIDSVALQSALSFRQGDDFQIVETRWEWWLMALIPALGVLRRWTSVGSRPAWSIYNSRPTKPT